MAVQTDKLRRMFDSDSKLMLQTLSHLVVEMSAGDSDPSKIDRAFRAAHSIKSEAGFLELSGVADAAHSLEESLATLRSAGGEGSREVSSKLSTELAELSREISEYHAAKPTVRESQGSSRGDVSAGEPLRAAELGMLREARGRNEKLYRVGVKLTCDPALYYPRGFLVVNNLEIECGVIQTSPSLDSLKGGGNGEMSILLTTTGHETQLRRTLSVDEVEVTDITELAYDEVESLIEPPPRETGGNGGSMLRIDSKAHEEIVLFADELTYLAGELSVLVGKTAAADDELQIVSRQLSTYAGVLKSRVDWTSRVHLLDVVRDLRDRSVAHAARDGKRIRFVVSGSGAVVSTAVAATLTDALLHLIRNSIDHGFETIQGRAKRGKPPAGTIHISVERMGESIRIRLSDDGVGIDEEALRRKTGDRERSLLDILATPGFSMRSEVDRSSGRGVGLDSVVHAVRDLLSGGIELDSEMGRGTVVNISIPTMSRLINVLVVDSSDGAAALPSSLVVEHRPLNLRRFKRDSFGGRYYDFQGESLPLLTVFGRNPA
ncbi:MAG: Hpt domain-containing protein, partial [Spirochaetaceae bacterium]|nr:Hpt domain-containing protein [Spirochaetaceae bacterium]